MRRITKFEKNLFLVLVLICPAIVGGTFTTKVNGSLLTYAIAASIGAVLWRVWIFLKDRRARARQQRKVA